MPTVETSRNIHGVKGGILVFHDWDEYGYMRVAGVDTTTGDRVWSFRSNQAGKAVAGGHFLIVHRRMERRTMYRITIGSVLERQTGRLVNPELVCPSPGRANLYLDEGAADFEEDTIRCRSYLDGTTLWTAPFEDVTPDPPMGRINRERLKLSPVPGEPLVLAHRVGRLMCLDLRTRRPVWDLALTKLAETDAQAADLMVREITCEPVNRDLLLTMNDASVGRRARQTTHIVDLDSGQPGARIKMPDNVRLQSIGPPANEEYFLARCFETLSQKPRRHARYHALLSRETGELVPNSALPKDPEERESRPNAEAFVVGTSLVLDMSRGGTAVYEHAPREEE